MEEEKRLVQEGRASLTEQILTDPELGKGFVPPQRIMQRLQSGESIKGVSKDAELGRMAMDFIQQTEKGRKILAEATPTEAATQGTAFKGPEGFSNVVGVGANPVLDTMNEQLVQLKVMSDFLAEIARPAGGGVPVDFTKKETPLLK